MQIGNVDVVATARGVAKEVVADDVTGLAAELAYRFFLALFPFVIMLAALSGFIADGLGVENPTQRIINNFASTLPPDTASVLDRQITEVVDKGNVGLISIGLVGALWAAGGGMGALIKALNRAYDVPETRPFWKKTLLALLMTLSAGVAVMAAFIILVGAGAWGEDIAGWIGADSAFAMTLTIVRWPIAVVLIMGAVALLYRLAPNIDQKFHFVSAGAVLFALVWLPATFAFSIYVSNFGSFNATYGALGGVVVLLLWFYVSSVVLLVGAELNAMIHAQVDIEGVEDRRQKVFEARRDAEPTPQEAFEEEHHGKAPLRPEGRERTGIFSSPLLTAAGLIAAFFALRKLAR